MRDFRPTLLALALLACATSQARSGEFVGLRASYQNFNMGRVARSTLLDGNGVVDVIRDELSGLLAFGGEYLNISNRMIYNVSLDYGSTRLLGRPTTRYEYVHSDSHGNVTASQATVTSQVARVSVGVGYNLTRLPSAFVYVNPGLSFEWGTWVTLDDATDQFIENGHKAPNELEVDTRLRAGFNLRLLTGVAIGEGTSLAVAPSWRYGWDVRQRATEAGLVDGLTHGRRLAFDLEVGLYRAIAP